MLKYHIPFVVSLVAIMVYGKYRCSRPDYKDPLETSITKDFDGWSVTHFLLHMYVGYSYPNSFFLATFIGILWELFEHYYGKNRPGWLGGYGDCEMQTDKEEGNWWYGKYSDIVANMAGFFVGRQIRLKYIY